jgi:hypothetical protein
MDALKIEWRYELEGFETPAGRYLPDFYLPRAARWIEIKGGNPTKRDMERAMHFGEAKWQEGEGFRMLIGDIPRQFATITQTSIKYGLPCMSYSQIALPVTEESDPATDYLGSSAPGELLSWPKESRGLISGFWVPGGSWRSPDEVDAALAAARSARFEFGQSPR